MMQVLFNGPAADVTEVALWHEAGHAVAAIHMGAKVLYFGLDPFPMCLVVPWGLSKHQRGVLMCAGGAMTRAVFGHEWGTHTDYCMAAALGDLEVFKREARELAESMQPEASFLVQSRLGGEQGRSARAMAGLSVMAGAAREDRESLPVNHRHRQVLEKIASKERMGRVMRFLVAKMASFQIRHPGLAAKLSRL